MDSFVPLILAYMLLISYVSCQSAKEEWMASEFYNPLTNGTKCGFPNNDAAYICDPNGILAVDDLKAVNWILTGVANNGAQCPCSAYFCETYVGPKGYKIAVALVKRMKKHSKNGKRFSSKELAIKFSSELKSKDWKMGKCEEDVVIFYSVDDKMLSIRPGITASVRLTPYYIDLMARKVAGRLNDGRIVEALNVLIYDIRVLLDCDLRNPYDCTIYDSGVASSIQTFWFSFTSLVTVVIVYLMHH